MLDVFVNRLISQSKLVELFPGWQTYGRTFFTVTPKSRFVAPRTRAFIEFLLASLDAQRRPAPGRVWGCMWGDGGGGENQVAGPIFAIQADGWHRPEKAVGYGRYEIRQ